MGPSSPSPPHSLNPPNCGNFKSEGCGWLLPPQTVTGTPGPCPPSTPGEVGASELPPAYLRGPLPQASVDARP